MPRSRAWYSFLASRAELRHLMEVARFQSNRLESNRLLTDQENQLRFVVVALIGQFQAYVADLMDELCDNLPDKWEQLAPFQKRYVAIQLRRRIEALLGEHSEIDLAEDKRLEQFKKAFSKCSEWPQRPATLASSSHREELHGFLTDNSSKSLDRAISQFRPDGMKFSDWLKKHYPPYREIFDALDNAIRLRNEAAHGQIGQRLTLRDARTYRVTIYRLIQKADEYLEVTSAPGAEGNATNPAVSATSTEATAPAETAGPSTVAEDEAGNPQDA